MPTKRLVTCENSIEAGFIINKLEQDGIECFLTNENFTSLFPNFTGILGAGVQVMVEEENYDIALKLIKENARKDVIRCPNCNSDQVIYSFGNKATGKIIAIILSLILWIPFGNIKRTCFCKECRTEFKR
ncbi:MAG TPA: DUF2007 domain-containing protein [Ignavibacteriaceae bacterium]|nr:DUF2007 domain-containing protein [Ignavibacteriaceae bacterium]